MGSWLPLMTLNWTSTSAAMAKAFVGRCGGAGRGEDAMDAGEGTKLGTWADSLNRWA